MGSPLRSEPFFPPLTATQGAGLICPDLGIFVSETVGGILRESGHKVKSIGLTKWTRPDVKAILKKGNVVAREHWLHRFNDEKSRRPDASVRCTWTLALNVA